MNDLNNILKILDSLQSEGADFIVIGGIAVILHGLPRVSEDLDIIINHGEENLSFIRKGLYKLYNDTDINEITINALENYSVIRYISPENDIIDIILTLGEAYDYKKIEYEIMDIYGKKIKVASVKSLIEMKSKTLREKDQLDLLFLKELFKKKI